MSPISILMIVIVLAAIATWLIPAGRYDRLSYTAGSDFTYNSITGDQALPFTQKTLDSLKVNIPLKSFQAGSITKPVSVPGTYKKTDPQPQGFMEILQAPLKGIYESIDVILFVLVLGGFIQIFNETGAMVRGIAALSKSMKGKEAWLIIILTFLFALGGASFGMAEEGFAFYPLLIPIFLAAGYDLLVPVAVIFGGTQLGTLASFTNPFSTIIASNAAGINWADGINERSIMFVIVSAIYIWYVVRYAQKVKKNPHASLVYAVAHNTSINIADEKAGNFSTGLDIKTKVLLGLFFLTFATMIYGVMNLGWWLTEMSTLFVGVSILIALILRMNESDFVKEFIKGAEGLLGVAFIVGVARGVSIVLTNGNISDSIIYHAANLAGQMPPALFILMLLAIYMVFTLFISSSSGMAVLTMPIMGSLAIMVNVPGREIVNAYLFGMGIIGFVSPTGLILPALAITNVSMKAWLKFIYPVLLLLLIACAACLVIGINFK
ncbi:MAG: YfcC family protein [Sphingobacteriaceae bacterium]|nr:MAG: YfcC family protein [Sphingobacteriaceae bacterium]